MVTLLIMDLLLKQRKVTSVKFQYHFQYSLKNIFYRRNLAEAKNSKKHNEL